MIFCAYHLLISPKDALFLTFLLEKGGKVSWPIFCGLPPCRVIWEHKASWLNGCLLHIPSYAHFDSISQTSSRFMSDLFNNNNVIIIFSFTVLILAILGFFNLMPVWPFRANLGQYQATLGAYEQVYSIQSHYIPFPFSWVILLRLCGHFWPWFEPVFR